MNKTNQIKCLKHITHLPYDIIKNISEFVNINQLLHSCKSFYYFKKYLIKLNFNEFYSLKYYNDIVFRKLINKLFCKNSLSLKIINNNDIIDVDFNILKYIHTLNLSLCKNIIRLNPLHNIHTLDLSYCTGITDVSMLGNVHSLNLSYCTGITDVSMLGNVYDLNLEGCSGIITTFPLYID